MNPSDINRLLNQARICQSEHPDGIHTFALYWIAWEAYRTRLLAVAIRLNGWRIEDAYFAVGAARISTQKKYSQCFKEITGIDLLHYPGVIGKAWRSLNEIESLRHRLLHGYKSANPALIEHSILFLERVFAHQRRLFGELPYSSACSKRQATGLIRDPLRSHPASGRGIPVIRDRQDLLQCLKVGSDQKPKRLPHTEMMRNLSSVTAALA